MGVFHGLASVNGRQTPPAVGVVGVVTGVVTGAVTGAVTGGATGFVTGVVTVGATGVGSTTVPASALVCPASTGDADTLPASTAAELPASVVSLETAASPRLALRRRRSSASAEVSFSPAVTSATSLSMESPASIADSAQAPSVSAPINTK
jgi:hypothetical protein